MGLFGKDKNNKGLQAADEVLLKDVIKETKELYDDLSSEYETIEAVVGDFITFVEKIAPTLDAGDTVKMIDFALQLKQVNKLARNSVRDVRDLLRYQKKLLAEVKR